MKISDLIIEEQIKLCNRCQDRGGMIMKKKLAALAKMEIVKLPNAFFLPNRFGAACNKEDGIGNNDSEIAWETDEIIIT